MEPIKAMFIFTSPRRFCLHGSLFPWKLIKLFYNCIITKTTILLYTQTFSLPQKFIFSFSLKINFYFYGPLKLLWALSVASTCLRISGVTQLCKIFSNRDAWVAQRLGTCLRLRPWSQDPGSSPALGSLWGACFSLCPCLCLSLSRARSLSLSVTLMNK